MSNPTPYQQKIRDGLILRTARDERDVERVAEFDGDIHGPEVTTMARNLFLHHPKTSYQDLIFVDPYLKVDPFLR